MSSNPNTDTGGSARRDAYETGEAEAVRRSFASLSMEKKLSTLLRIELDLVGDIADAVVSAANRVVDELGRAMSSSRQSTHTSTTPPGSTHPGTGGSTSTGL
jgi:hypothetical protein